MNVNSFFDFSIGDFVELKSGTPTTELLMIIEIRKNSGSRTGDFTVVRRTGEKLNATGIQLKKIKGDFEKFPLPEGSSLKTVQG